MPAETEDDELSAIQQVIAALTPLGPEARERVIQYVFGRLGIDEPTSLTPSASVHDSSDSRPVPTSARATDIRTFTEQKTPRSANEMAAVVGYYLAELAPASDRKLDITSADIEKYFKQGNFRLPSKPGMTLTNAKNAGYLDSGSERGVFRLNPVGHNLVAHGLPAQDGNSQGRKKATRKKGARKKGAKKKRARKKSSGRR